MDGSDQSEQGEKLVFLQGQERWPTLWGFCRMTPRPQAGARAGLGASLEPPQSVGDAGMLSERAVRRGCPLPSEPPKPPARPPLCLPLLAWCVVQLVEQNFVLSFSPRPCPPTAKHPHSLPGLGAPVCSGRWTEPQFLGEGTRELDPGLGSWRSCPGSSPHSLPQAAGFVLFLFLFFLKILFI